MHNLDIRRGDIYYADLGNGVGSEQNGERPVLIIQNDKGNLHSPTVIAAAITTKKEHKNLPTHVHLLAGSGNLSHDSTVMTEQIRTLDKTRLRRRIGHLQHDMMIQIDLALVTSVGFQITR